MSENPQDAENVVRRQTFDVEGPLELDLATGQGRLEVRLVDEPGVHVEVRHDVSGANPFTQGLSSLMNFIGAQMGNDLGGGDPAATAVRETRVDLTAGRLVVRTPKEVQLRNVPVAVSVQAPVGSHLRARAGSGDVAVSGAVGRLDAQTGSGRISTDQATGGARVETGSGVVRLGPMVGGLRAKTGSGDLEVTAVGAPSTVVTGSGDVWLGTVTGDVLVRTGSGAVTIATATSGELELHTGSGAIRVGVRKGCPAEVDLSTGSGEARSELDLTLTPPENKPPLKIRGRSGSGGAFLTSAIE
jgi:hypothetical protein